MRLENMQVKKRNGSLELLNIDKINRSVERACYGIEDVYASEIVVDASIQLYDGVTTKEIDQCLIMSAKAKIEKDPGYSLVAARLLLNTLYKEVFQETPNGKNLQTLYKSNFVANLEALVEAGRLKPELLRKFNLKRLAGALQIHRDHKFKYLGLQTLYDRYFIHIDGRRMETPQAFFMRVAMGIALNEKDEICDEMAIKFYNLFSTFKYMPSTPTLFNSGTINSQLSSCYLSTMHDSDHGIMGTISDQAVLSKYAGGIGVDASYIRGDGSYIKGTNGRSNGVIPFLRILNDTLVAWNQGGKRKGSGCVYLEAHHRDVEDFVEICRTTGDERLRCPDLHTALWISDLFMERVVQDGEWYLFSADETPELHELYGDDYRLKYLEYEEMAKAGKLKNFKVISAKQLYKKILFNDAETGHPWHCFKDISNACYMNKNAGVVHCSNLCTEILRHTIATLYDKRRNKMKTGETAVCNLGSLNGAEHLVERVINNEVVYRIDLDELARSATLTVRILDNVIDQNFYPIEEAELSNLRHRPIGLGLMGFQDILYAYGIPYDSEEAVQLSHNLQERIAYYATLSSIILAKEKGTFSSYEGSEWSKLRFHHEIYDKVCGNTGRENIKYELNEDWEGLRGLLKQYGIRNSNLLAIAPTATISYIVGCEQSIEPNNAVLHVYSTLSGDFTIINEWFVRKMKKINLWNNEMLAAIKSNDGDISGLDLPDEIKRIFKTAFQVNQKYLVDCASARQRFIDMGQSFNLYHYGNSLKALYDQYMYCFYRGLKTTYYPRSKAASRVEKSSVELDKPQQSSYSTSGGGGISACSLAARARGEVCESCQ